MIREWLFGKWVTEFDHAVEVKVRTLVRTTVNPMRLVIERNKRTEKRRAYLESTCGSRTKIALWYADQLARERK